MEVSANPDGGEGSRGTTQDGGAALGPGQELALDLYT